MKKGIIFLIDLLFAILIASSFIYIVSYSSYNIFSIEIFEDPFPYDVVTIYTKTQNIQFVKEMFEEKGYSGRFDNISISYELCSPKNDMYVKYIGPHKIIYCKVIK